MSYPTSMLNTTSKIEETFETFQRQVAAYHDSMINAHSLLQNAVKQSKTSILKDFDNSSLINENGFLKHQNEELKQQNEELRRRYEIERLDADQYHADSTTVKGKLEKAENRIKDLERDLEESHYLLSKLGTYTNQLVTGNKRDRSPSPQAERKRGRSIHDRINGFGTNEQNDRSRPANFHHEGTDVNKYQPRNSSHGVLEELRRTTKNPHSSTKVNDYIKNCKPDPALANEAREIIVNDSSGYEEHSRSTENGITIMGRAHNAPTQPAADTRARNKQPQSDARPRPPPQHQGEYIRRLVCHACYDKKIKCDNAITCHNCQEVGATCMRTRCSDFHDKNKCHRIGGDCFRIHAETGYNTTDFNPFRIHGKKAVNEVGRSSGRGL